MYLEVEQSAGVWSNTPPAHLSDQVLLLSGRHLLEISVDWKSSSMQLSDEVSSVNELSAKSCLHLVLKVQMTKCKMLGIFSPR